MSDLGYEITCDHYLATVKGNVLTCAFCSATTTTEELALTENMGDDGIDWGNVNVPEGETISGPEPTIGAFSSYPSYPDNPHNHRYTVSFTGSGAPMIVVRANTAAEVTAALNELEAYGAYANVGAAHAALKHQGAAGNGLGPVTPVSPVGPPPGLPPMQSPGGPPFGPNVSAPQAPGYQGAPAQAAWQPQPQQMQQGYQAQQQMQQGPPGKADPKPQPPGWARANARTGPGFDAWKAMREQYKDQLKGKVAWGGNADYWVAPEVAGWISQQGFAVTP